MVNQHMTSSDVELGVVDKRRSMSARGDGFTHLSSGPSVFVANAGGTNNTLVGANAAPGTNDNNVIRRGEKFRLYNSAGVLKEETVFEVTGIAVGASTTVTFSPNAAVATANGDQAKLTGGGGFKDIESLDDELTRINSTSYSPSRLAQMTVNDKIWAIRQAVDPEGV